MTQAFDPAKTPTVETPPEESAKRRQIIDGARSVFLASGFDAASMGEIAAAGRGLQGHPLRLFRQQGALFEAIIESERRAPGRAGVRARPHRSRRRGLAEAARRRLRALPLPARSARFAAHRDGHRRAHARSRPQASIRQVRRSASRGSAAYLEPRWAGVLDVDDARSRPRSSSMPASRPCSSR